MIVTFKCFALFQLPRGQEYRPGPLVPLSSQSQRSLRDLTARNKMEARVFYMGAGYFSAPQLSTVNLSSYLLCLKT